MGSSKFDHIKVDIPKEGKDETRNIPDPDNYSLDQQENNKIRSRYAAQAYAHYMDDDCCKFVVAFCAIPDYIQ